jgi:hypothetical protein
MPATRPPAPPNPFPPPRPVYQQPMAPDQGIPTGLANAFTITPIGARPIPANFGPPAVAANAFTAPEESQQNTSPSAPSPIANGFSLPFQPQQGPYQQGPYPGTAGAMAGMPGAPMGSMGPMGPLGPAGFGPGMTYGAPPYNPMMMAPQPRPAMLPAQAQAPAGPTSSHLLAMLKDSLYPSEREWAAEYLARQDWRTQPQVVQGLVTAAREDPAATVRAGCVRALAQMKVNTLPVVSVVQSLKADTDPRVRQEVEEALPALGVALEAHPDANIRPASLPEAVAESKVPEAVGNKKAPESEEKKPPELECDKK